METFGMFIGVFFPILDSIFIPTFFITMCILVVRSLWRQEDSLRRQEQLLSDIRKAVKKED